MVANLTKYFNLSRLFCVSVSFGGRFRIFNDGLACLLGQRSGISVLWNSVIGSTAFKIWTVTAIDHLDVRILELGERSWNH